ncbi:MAG: S41 family peptidase [Cyanobacteria bacterium J06639_1]
MMLIRPTKVIATAALLGAAWLPGAMAQIQPMPVLENPNSAPFENEVPDVGNPEFDSSAEGSQNPAVDPAAGWDAPSTGWEGFSQPTQPTRAYSSGADLRQVVEIFSKESLAAGSNPQAVAYDELYESAIALQSSAGLSPVEAEYQVIRETLTRYGLRGDRLLTPNDFSRLLNQPRPPVQARSLAAGVTMLTIGDITPATAKQVRQNLYANDYTRGVVLDLRGSTGYDPQAIANVARIFMPRSMSPAIASLDRFEKETTWDSKDVPIAARTPLVTLVDGRTERGAVILAALMGARGNARIAGEPTAGTDTQTRFFVLPSGAAIEMAVARWRPDADAGFGQNTLVRGLVPSETLSGFDVESQALGLLPDAPAIAIKPNIFQESGRIGRFELGFDARQSDIGALGGMDSVSSSSGENIFQPGSDLRIFYLKEYILFAYRNQGTLSSFFADRIYMTDDSAQTEEGLRLGASYSDVVRTYGAPGENGYNEISPFPRSTRVALDEDRYFINYDALGLSFAFETGTNQVVAIGLYKPGS